MLPWMLWAQTKGLLLELACYCPSWGSLGMKPLVQLLLLPSRKSKMGKSKGTLGLLSLLGAVTAQAGAFSLGRGPKPCLAEPPPAPNPTGVGKHVPSPKGCWQRDASSSLCLKAVKINLFLKSSPETLSWSPPSSCCMAPGGWGDQGSEIHPVGAAVWS